MMVRFEEDEYIAVAIFDAGNRIQTGGRRGTRIPVSWLCTLSDCLER